MAVCHGGMDFQTETAIHDAIDVINEQILLGGNTVETEFQVNGGRHILRRPIVTSATGTLFIHNATVKLMRVLISNPFVKQVFIVKVSCDVDCLPCRTRRHLIIHPCVNHHLGFLLLELTKHLAPRDVYRWAVVQDLAQNGL